MFSSKSSIKSNYCSQHQNEPLTNYCSNAICKIGLCATCICEHTQKHLREGTEPIYSNIKDLQLEVAEQLEAELEETKSILDRLGDVTQKIQNKEFGLKEVMKTVRKEAMEGLLTALTEVEQRLHSDILSDAQKHGLHNQSRIEALTDKVKRERSCFIQGIEQIRRPDFVSELKILTDTVLEGGRSTMNEIKSEIENNEKYMTDLQFDRQSLKTNLSRAIQNVVVISFTLPDSLRKRQQQIVVPQHSLCRLSEASQSTSDLKLVRPINPHLRLSEHQEHSYQMFGNTPKAKQMVTKFSNEMQVPRPKFDKENKTLLPCSQSFQNLKTNASSPKFF